MQLLKTVADPNGIDKWMQLNSQTSSSHPNFCTEIFRCVYLQKNGWRRSLRKAQRSRTLVLPTLQGCAASAFLPSRVAEKEGGEEGWSWRPLLQIPPLPCKKARKGGHSSRDAAAASKEAEAASFSASHQQASPSSMHDLGLVFLHVHVQF